MLAYLKVLFAMCSKHQLREPAHAVSVLAAAAHHSFSFLTSSCSALEKSFLMFHILRISSVVLPLSIAATVLQTTSRRSLISRKLAARMISNSA